MRMSTSCLPDPRAEGGLIGRQPLARQDLFAMLLDSKVRALGTTHNIFSPDLDC